MSRHDRIRLDGIDRSRDPRSRVSPRSPLALFRAAVAALALGMVLSACGPAQEPGPPAAGPAKAAAKEAPAAFTGGGSLKVLIRAHFVPAYDKWVDGWAKAWGEKNKVDVSVDHVRSVDVVEKVAAEVAAQAGHDIIALTRAGETYLYAPHLVDVSDLAKALGEKNGGWLPGAQQLAVVGGAWLGVTEYFSVFPVLYRKDLFDQIGKKPGDTWEGLVEAGALLKAKGNPVGIPIAQKASDSNNAWNMFLWSYGASYVGQDGKTVTINSPETRAALKVAIDLYTKTMTNEVLTWDDAGNNRCLAAGRCSWIVNPISALRTMEKDTPDLAKNIFLGPPPAGPKGRFSTGSVNVLGVMRWSKSQAAAKAFLADYFASFADAFKASEGFNFPLLGNFVRKPMAIYGDDPKLGILQDAAEWTRFAGYPGPGTAAAGEVDSNWIMPLMVGRAVTSGNAEEAITWAEQKIKAIYAKHQ